MTAFAPKDAVKQGLAPKPEVTSFDQDLPARPVYKGEHLARVDYPFRGATLTIELYRWAPDPRPDAEINYRLRFLLPKGFIDERTCQSVVLETSSEEQAIALLNYALAEARLVGPHMAVENLVHPETAHSLRDASSVTKRPFRKVQAYKVGL